MTTNVLAFPNGAQAVPARLPNRPPFIQAFSTREKAAEHLRHPDAYLWERGGIFIVRRRVDGTDLVMCGDGTWRDLDIPWLATSLGRPCRSGGSAEARDAGQIIESQQMRQHFGVLAALPAARLLRSLLFGLAPIHVVTLGAAALLRWSAPWRGHLPARRAAKVDPIADLRNE